MEPRPFAIEVKDLVKVYKTGDVHALNGLNLRIRQGEIYAFIGANGTGKSTAINIMTGILNPTSGEVRIFGKDIRKAQHQLSSRIGMAPQEYAIYLDLSVAENIYFFGKIYGMRNGDIGRRLTELLDVLQLTDKRETLCRNLSGGMKRRVSLACALIHAPELIFLDEATVGVDPILRNFFWDYFRQLRDLGVTLVITSHVMDEAERADRIGLIRAGQLIAEGTPSELKKKYEAQTIEEIFIKLSGDELNG